jgi:hypothetical protein
VGQDLDHSVFDRRSPIRLHNGEALEKSGDNIMLAECATTLHQASAFVDL